MSERIHSAERVLRVLDTLLENFGAGLTTTEVASAARVSPPAATRALQTLLEADYVERIRTTKRWRPSHRLARSALEALKSLDTEIRRLGESRRRIDPGR